MRLGIQVRACISAWFFARRLRSEMPLNPPNRLAEDGGLLSSESFAIAINHFGFLQYWRSFDDLEAWVRRPPHAEWWQKAVERMRLEKGSRRLS